MPGLLRRWWYRFRSSATGRFISREEFEATDPDETERERVER